MTTISTKPRVFDGRAWVISYQKRISIEEADKLLRRLDAESKDQDRSKTLPLYQKRKGSSKES